MKSWVFVGVQVFPGIASALLINVGKTTRVLVGYETDRPVLIRQARPFGDIS